MSTCYAWRAYIRRKATQGAAAQFMLQAQYTDNRHKATQGAAAQYMLQPQCTDNPHNICDSLIWFLTATSKCICNDPFTDVPQVVSYVYLYMWQSRVEIEGYFVAYFVAYFDHITVFEALYHWTSVKGGVRTHFIDAWISNESMKHIWAPSLMKVQRYGASRQRCGWNTWQNNLRFLHRTATYIYIYT